MMMMMKKEVIKIVFYSLRAKFLFFGEEKKNWTEGVHLINRLTLQNKSKWKKEKGFKVKKNFNDNRKINDAITIFQKTLLNWKKKKKKWVYDIYHWCNIYSSAYKEEHIANCSLPFLFIPRLREWESESVTKRVSEWVEKREREREREREKS